MWGILISAFGFILRYLLGGSVMKWAFMAFIAYGCTELLNMLIGLLPSWLDPANLSSNMSSFSSGMWYFFDYFQAQYGIGLLLSAVITRFLIRRIPIIG